MSQRRPYVTGKKGLVLLCASLTIAALNRHQLSIAVDLPVSYYMLRTIPPPYLRPFYINHVFRQDP